MDTITTIIVTVLANAIATGIIVYLIQKKIENSFAKQIKEFEAKLQYSNFEQQTKFAAMYPKRVETLETLYEKFRIFDEVFTDWTRVIRVDKQGSRETDQKLHIERSEYVLGKLNDFWNYFEANRLFLPDNITHQIWEVFRKAGDAETILELISRNPEANLPIGVSSEFKGIETKWGKTEATIAAISFEVNKLATILEKLYKSVAEGK